MPWKVASLGLSDSVKSSSTTSNSCAANRSNETAPVVLICRTGSRTDKLARELMEKHGYTRIYNVRNGITRWIGESNPIVKNL